MILHLKKKIGQAIGLKKLEKFDISDTSWNWKEIGEINLARMSVQKLDQLQALLEMQRELHGVGVLLKDIATWKSAITSSGVAKARTVKQFASLLERHLGDVKSHHVYERQEDGTVCAYYVERVGYAPRSERPCSYPEHAWMNLIYEELGTKHETKIEFMSEACARMSVAEAMARKELFTDTMELRAIYDAEMKLYSDYVSKIGKQFLSVGIGTDDLDGNPSRDRYYGSTKVKLVRDGIPTRVVIDVFKEEDEENNSRKREVVVDTYFWKRGKDENDDDSSDDEDEDLQAETAPIEIPVHPYLAVFDLSKHLRLRVHVGNLTEYIYDRALADKLVLKPELKSLVSMLIEHKDGSFRDIVKGKAGGAVVLLAGFPGTGKTLTAEVYAESEGRALYSIQCSQLGTNPESLESNLLKVFARSKRWNAVMLLDEADVYVHERGRDMNQNAVVGVFLRVLEYQSSVLFLTTNRPDDVDDAIASRCIARLTYEFPNQLEKERIWRILAASTGAHISDATIESVSAAPMSGRDIKNLLKLAMLMKPRQEVTAADIAFVKQFQPTARYEKDKDDGWME